MGLAWVLGGSALAAESGDGPPTEIREPDAETSTGEAELDAADREAAEPSSDGAGGNDPVQPSAAADPTDAGPDEPDAAPVELRPPRFLEPARIVGRDRQPTGRTVARFTTRPPLVRPALRIVPAFSARLTGRPYAAFGFDVLASMLFGLHGGARQLGLAPEVGYSLRAPGVDHRLLVGMGLVHGINVESWTVGVLPRAVLQSTPEGLGVGVRTGLWFDFAENGFSVELSHQWLPVGDRAHHELQLGLGLDVAMLIIVLTGAEVAWL